MTRSSEDEKQRLELEAASIFLQWYQSHTQRPCKLLHANLPAKPDVSCKIGTAHIDLEIAHLYGSETEAMQILGRELPQQTRNELAELNAQENTQRRLHVALARILKQKANKHYHSREVWLIIRNMHPQWRPHEAVLELRNCIQPLAHPFKHIWLVSDQYGANGVLQLI
ncbi:hypothetical protein QTP81_10400 [Alteromonas sp. ASW11-36]|uniref:Uncharacterized protein n=1 Tax=Alteromonas arenosi TaxID=3055817 RepID=A0ABT7SXU8_9ALTE|nr:hypothetical protein [Alteromonas sp. ASW11-36]MDM7861008.1 hypothetical protein [Alteromonas sp. ASW11-36]